MLYLYLTVLFYHEVGCWSKGWGQSKWIKQNSYTVVFFGYLARWGWKTPIQLYILPTFTRLQNLYRIFENPIGVCALCPRWVKNETV
jgi:hypothetical protein